MTAGLVAGTRDYGGDCRARGYESIGCDQTRTLMWSYEPLSERGYCGFEFAEAKNDTWMSASPCKAARESGDEPGLDFILLKPGCSIEVATEEDGGGERFVYHRSVMMGV